MIIKNIKILDWNVKILIITGQYNINFILNELQNIGCKQECVKQAVETIIEGKHNIGFTYSNSRRKKSLIIIGLQDSTSQLINTIAHESRHLQQHIANSKNLDQNSEDVCYLLGEIVQKIYTICSNYFII